MLCSRLFPRRCCCARLGHSLRSTGVQALFYWRRALAESMECHFRTRALANGLGVTNHQSERARKTVRLVLAAAIDGSGGGLSF